MFEEFIRKLHLIRIGYKIVSYRCECLDQYDNSFKKYTFYSAFGGTSAVKYEFNKWTHPLLNCGPLALFGSLRKALGYIRRCSRPFKVFKCFYIKSEFTMMHDENEWLEKEYVPEGTILADCIMLLLDDIEDNEY